MRHAGTRHLVIMAKEPVVGRVKTRLANDIGAPAAATIYRKTVANVAARLSADPRWQTYLSVAPATAVSARSLPQLPRVAQNNGDLGERMQAIFDWPIRGPIIIVGTDIPGIDRPHIERAFRALKGSDMVYGRTTDGGFWLVGMRRSPRIIDAFGQVRWSTSETLADCLANLSGYNVKFADRLVDLDDQSDLLALGPVVNRRVLPSLQRG